MKKVYQGKGKRKRVEISLDSHQTAYEVLLMGDFNEWNQKKHRMKKNDQGIWQKTVVLEPGAYEYKFLVDGEWIIDDQNGLICDNCYGTKNNFVLI